MKAALLGLESVDDCAVSRTKDAGTAGQHVWSVTFLEVILDRWMDTALWDVNCGKVSSHPKVL